MARCDSTDYCFLQISLWHKEGTCLTSHHQEKRSMAFFTNGIIKRIPINQNAKSIADSLDYMPASNFISHYTASDNNGISK
jgi:hypothetical protein